MINFIIGLIIGFIAGMIVERLLRSARNDRQKMDHNDSKSALRNDAKESVCDTIELPEAIEQKAENLVKLKEAVAGTSDQITNDWVQKKLGVSDATAVRYLDELEKEGIIKQVGETGRSTYYTKI